MANKRNTKRALLSSGIALLVSIAMLVGSTYAWFTDSVTSGGNKIQAGTLKLDLELMDKDTGNWASIKEDKTSLFDYVLWEPGYTEAKVLKVENEGTLALKWVAKFTAQKELSKLAEVIDVYVNAYGVLDDATGVAYPADRTLDGYTKVGTLKDFVNTIEETTYGALKAEESAYLGIALKMQETAGNEYQGLDLGGEFDITIYATQDTVEEDSFDNQYDKDAEYDAVFSNTAVFEDDESSKSIEIRNDQGYKVASAVVPKAAMAGNEDEVKVIVTPDAANSALVIADGKDVKTFDVKVLGLKEGNSENVKVELRIEAGLDPATVELYHYGTKIPSTYNPHEGYVTFESAEFSPFSIVYDAESEYVPPVIPDEPETDPNLPKANVVQSTEYENVDLPWGSYGQWSPTEGLDSKLEAAYTFSCIETLEEAKKNPYANWYCDFYVMLDKDLGENEIFLGGNYGSFGWVGFHNGDVTLEANKELPLLGSVTSNPWTYLDVVQNVGTFICGVGDVDDKLADATFTVMLRLTNPENENEFVNVATKTHTFTKTVNSGEELQDAINNGNTNIELGGDIDLSQGIVIPGN